MYGKGLLQRDGDRRQLVADRTICQDDRFLKI